MLGKAYTIVLCSVCYYYCLPLVRHGVDYSFVLCVIVIIVCILLGKAETISALCVIVCAMLEARADYSFVLYVIIIKAHFFLPGL